MAETEVMIRIARALESIGIILAFINAALWLILFCKRSYSYTDGIKEAIKELTNIIKSRR